MGGSAKGGHGGGLVKAVAAHKEGQDVICIPSRPAPRVDTSDCYKSNTCLYLTTIVDGDLPDGQPKALEFFTACPIDDLSLYGIRVNNNGADPAPWGAPDWNFPAVSVLGGV
eukprot:GHVR01107677.1.p1 GENE.GHVR01107677.1~~GHVR01107677.1.p1  ORF type:complete len:121 (+),score=35.72 GHVR01107677.1:28-363(+)